MMVRTGEPLSSTSSSPIVILPKVPCEELESTGLAPVPAVATTKSKSLPNERSPHSPLSPEPMPGAQGPPVAVTATFVPTLPWYLDGADDEVVENYDAWAARYGADPLGTNLVAFLLDADPAVAVPAGAEPLKVVDFALANGVLRFEIASEWVAFQNPNPPPPGVVRVTSLLGNGFLVLRSAPSLPCDDADWEESRLWIVDWLPDGHVVAEFEPKRSSSALPARFFRPAISTVAPDDDSGGQYH